MKMDLRELLLVFSMLWTLSSGLRCYKCKPQKDAYDSLMCENFDYSEKYMTECQYSTMCYRKEITSSLGNELKYYERDCAKQTMKDDQQMNSNGQWIYVNKIYENVEVGCKTESPNEKVTRTVHCFCKGDLCNGAASTIGTIMGTSTEGTSVVESRIAAMTGGVVKNVGSVIVEIIIAFICARLV